MKVRKPLMCSRIALVVLMLCLLSGSSIAQRFSAALTAGLNASQVDGDDLAGFDKVGISAGIKAIMLFDSPISLNMEFLYNEKGSRPDIFNPDYDPDININLQYAELPVYLAYGDWWQEDKAYYKVSVLGGLSYGRLIQASTRSGDGEYDPISQYFNQNEISWLLGVNYRINNHWGVTGRYTRGITPLLSPEKHNLTFRRLLSYYLTVRIEYYFK